MNSPFAVYPADAQPARRGPFSVKTPLVVFLVCLVLGLGVVIWRASSQRKAAESRARDAALARTTALESELNRQLISAVEVLETLARQNGGTIPNFQKVAAELLQTRPALASLELQPGGIVSDIAPRTGHDRGIGVNVLKDPALGPGAATAWRSRALTVSGPVRLYGGEWVFVARVPVVQRGRDGRETFSFVAGSMRLGAVLTAAQLADLATQGYDYELFIPAAGAQKALKLASQGGPVLPQAWHPTARVQNADFRLAVQPHGGWMDKSKLACEVVGVLLLASLLAVLANLLESRGAMETALAEANRRVDRETTERKKAQELEQQSKSEIATLQADLRKARTAQEEAESAKAELQRRLEESERNANEAKATLEAQVKQAERKAAELQKRVDVVLKTADELAKATERKFGETQARIQELEQTLTETQGRLEESAQAREKLAAAQAQGAQEQGEVARLQAQLEANARAATKSAETAAAKLKKAEEANQELKERLKVSKQEAAERIAELTTQLEAARAAAHAEPEPEPEPIESTEPETPVFESEPEEEATAMAEAEPVEPEPVEETEAEPVEAEGVKPAEAEPAEAAAAEPAEAEPVEAVAETAPVIAAAETGVPEAAALEATPAPAPQLEEPANESPVPAPEQTSAPKPVKEPRRRKSRRDNQMDLFGGSASESALEAGKQEDHLGAAARLAAVSARNEGRKAVERPEQGEAEAEPKQPEKTEEAKPARRLPPAPPVDLPELRKAINVILPLLMDQDPGAKDCLKDNRTTFRSAFTPEGYVEFEQLVKSSEFVPALEHLKKAARKHGVSV